MTMLEDGSIGQALQSFPKCETLIKRHVKMVNTQKLNFLWMFQSSMVLLKTQSEKKI